MDDRRAEFLEHLEELRFAIIRSLLVIVIGATAASMLVQPIVALLQYPFVAVLGEDEALVFTRPGEAFGALVQVILVSGLLIALPSVLMEVWAFVAPGLTRSEKKYVGLALPLALLLFAAGVGFSYAVMPLALRILHGVGGMIGLRALWSMSACIVFLLWMCLLFGLLFQLPLVMTVLAVVGIVPAVTFARGRRYAIFVIAAAVAAVTPTGDIFTMALMSLPLVLLYEVGILVARRLEPRREGAA